MNADRASPARIDSSRRRFVGTGGALVLSFALRPAFGQGGLGGEGSEGVGAQTAAGAPLPGSLKVQPLLDGWIRIAADGRVTVFTGKAELGQGIRTALIQVAAEQLMVPVDAITLVTADTERTANEGYTAGSHSMQDSGTAIEHAAAQVRALLLGLAAERWSVPVQSLKTDNGRVHGDAGRSIGYGELVSPQTLHVSAAPQSELRDPREHTVMGKAVPRVDIPAKVTGGEAYVQDMRLPGMVHGRVLRPPSPAARLTRLDSASVERVPGVLKVVRDGRFVGVIAGREFEAITAMRRLAVSTAWDESATLPAMDDLYQSVRSSPSQDHVILDKGVPNSPGKSVSATYRRPYQMHASIGPSCAIAQLVDGRYTVWTHTQGVYPLRKALAELVGVPAEDVRCIHVEGSGCYGHNGADDVAADAVLLARALPGRPVRVQWMREDEHAWEPLGPPMISSVKATLDASGAITDWQFEVWSNTHSTRPGAAGDLLAGTHLEQPFAPTPPVPLPQPEGGGDRNAIPLYDLPNARVVHHFLPDMPLRVSALRSLGAYCNIFAIESFMDELARAANADPVVFRLRHLKDPRARDVVQLAAEQFGWNAFKRQPGRGRGFAFARYKNLGAYAAMAFEVEVSRDTGAVRVLRAVAATDSGEIVNPDGIRNQIEGGIVQSMSWTLAEEVTFDRMRVISRDWGGYPILRFPQVPERIEVHSIDRPGQPFLGTGEASQGPAAAALANALHDASGVRFRDVPLSRKKIRAALEA
ncbi:MAG: aldehyde dehydrogenase [Rhizobacter sp.]|nr:aldehyde dehydrogenase [Rhizobacter sp.]